MVLHRVGSAAGFTACASSNLALSASYKKEVSKINAFLFFIFLTSFLPYQAPAPCNSDGANPARIGR
jgi:hypothetical protein